MDLKKNPDTRGLAPSLISILDIIRQMDRSFIRFRITSDHLSSADNINHPKYLKDTTV